MLVLRFACVCVVESTCSHAVDMHMVYAIECVQLITLSLSLSLSLTHTHTHTRWHYIREDGMMLPADKPYL